LAVNKFPADAGASYMLLGALQSRTAAANTLASRTARTVRAADSLRTGSGASPLRSPAANWDDSRARRVGTQATADTATMAGIRSVKQVRSVLLDAPH